MVGERGGSFFLSFSYLLVLLTVPLCCDSSKKVADGKEVYEFNGKYWEARKDPGFNRMTFVKIF